MNQTVEILLERNSNVIVHQHIDDVSAANGFVLLKSRDTNYMYSVENVSSVKVMRGDNN